MAANVLIVLSPTFGQLQPQFEEQFTTLPRPGSSVILREMMRLGSLNLSSNLFLSPLAGYTNLPFRLALREIGGLGPAPPDLVNARPPLAKKPQALYFIETSPAEPPPAVQLFCSLPGGRPDA